MPTSPGSAPLRFKFTCWLLPVLVVLSGCRLVHSAARVPADVVTAVTPGAKTQEVDPALLQSELQRFADEYASRTIAALDVYSASAGTEEARRRAPRWKLAATAAAVTIATGPNPQANLLDFLALATITRLALEQEQSKSTNAPAFDAWVSVSRSLETNAWRIAEANLTPDQQQEMRDAIQRWWDARPEKNMDFFARPEEFGGLIRKPGRATTRPGSVFAVVGLDPTAGLDPAVREVTRTRLFAERAMFMMQRLPFLVRWQVELLADQLLREDLIAGVLTNTPSLAGSVDRISRAAESASATAAQLPDRITAERKAILEALADQEGRLRELSAEIARTLTAGEQMSTSLNTAITTFDALMKRFGVGELAPAGPSRATNAPPFNILDYARTAEQIAAMAREIDGLLKDADTSLDSPALDRRIRELNSLLQRARSDAKSALNHAFLLGAGMILLALGAGLVYRRSGRSVRG